MGYPFPAKPFFQPPRQAIAAKGGAPTIAPSKAPLREGTAATKKLSECRVLVVDDDPNNALLMSIRLRNSVKSVDTAETAAGAISKISEAAKNGKYDLVICDMRLDRGATALDVEAEVKKSAPSTVFIIASGAENADLPAGAIHLKKPFSKEDALALLGEFFSN